MSGQRYPKPTPCDHGVTFEEPKRTGLGLLAREAAIPAEEVRKRWPRLDGECPKGCGYHGIAYASVAHYVWGDW